MLSHLAKRTKTSDENVANGIVSASQQGDTTKSIDQKDFEDKTWFEESSETEVFDRWFECDGNSSGGRYNLWGNWVGEFDGETDWHDFEACLEHVPELAKLKEGCHPIIQHCCHVSTPPVPVSVVKKLIEINPSVLQERINRVADPYAEDDNNEQYRHNVTVLVLYMLAPGFVIDRWNVSFDVCKVLVEAEPKLLFYKDTQKDTGKEVLLWEFPEQGKKLLEELGKSVDLEALEKEVQAEEAEEEKRRQEEEVEY